MQPQVWNRWIDVSSPAYSYHHAARSDVVARLGGLSGVCVHLGVLSGSEREGVDDHVPDLQNTPAGKPQISSNTVASRMPAVRPTGRDLSRQEQAAVSPISSRLFRDLMGMTYKDPSDPGFNENQMGWQY